MREPEHQAPILQGPGDCLPGASNPGRVETHSAVVIPGDLLPLLVAAAVAGPVDRMGPGRLVEPLLPALAVAQEAVARAVADQAGLNPVLAALSGELTL